MNRKGKIFIGVKHLSERVSYASELGRAYSGMFNKAPEQLKVDVHVQLKDLVSEGLVERLETVDQWGQPLVWYADRTKGEGLFHKALVDSVVSVFASQRLSVNRLGGANAPDLQYGDIPIEVETGLKQKLGSFVSKARGGKAWVVVPNKKMKLRYTKALGKGALVFTLYDLKRHLRGGGRG